EGIAVPRVGTSQVLVQATRHPLGELLCLRGLREVVWVIGSTVGMSARSQVWQHAGEDLEPEVLFVAEAVGTTLEHADLVVQALDEAEGDLVLRAAVGRDPVPAAVNHHGKPLATSA